MLLPGVPVMFQETQWAWSSWITWIIVPVAIAVLVFIKVITKLPVFVVVPILLAIVGFVMSLHLTITVEPGSIVVRLFPLTTRTIPVDQVQSAEARTYSPIREYGGWGLRRGPSGTAYNLMGDRGVQLVLRSGERVLLGSQEADRLAQAIDRARRGGA
jgi:hypothetical protein